MSASGGPIKRLIASGSTFESEIGYSRAVVVGDQVFVSGTTGFDYSTMTIAPGIEDQTEKCFANLNAALVQAGASLADAVRIVYMLPDAAEFPKCWPILKRHLGQSRPAATMIQVGLADPRMRIEIELIALRGCGRAIDSKSAV